MIKKEKYGIVQVGLLSALMMLIIMLPSMLQNHGFFIIRGDYVDQYLSRILKAKEVFASGSASWDWLNFLGAPYNRINAMLSLNAVCYLFPAKLVPYAVTYMHLVRVALIAMCSFAFLRRMVKAPKNAFLGALLYTFSSYFFLNMEFMQFHDAMWAFPLLLLAVENMFTGKQYKHQLILAVFLNCANSFYFFVFSTISFSLYFVCRFFLSEEWKPKRKAKYFFLAVTEYIIGFLCAFFVFATFIYSMFHSSGSTGNIGASFSPIKFLADTSIVSRVFSLFVPAVSNRFSSFGSATWHSLAAYLPVFGMSMVVALVWKKDSPKWLKVLSCISVLCLMITGISFIYNILSSSYTRYSYTMLLFFALATVMFLEHYDEKLAKKGAFLTTLCLIGLLALYYGSYIIIGHPMIVNFLLHNNNTGYDTARICRVFVLVASCVMYLTLFGYVYSEKIRKRILPILVAVTVLYGCAYTSLNLTSRNLLDYHPTSKVDLRTQVDRYYIDIPDVEEGTGYRIDHSRQLRNYAYAVKKPAISIFESVRGQYSGEFCRYFNYDDRSVQIAPKSQDNELRTMLGVKYYFDLYPEDGVPVPEGFTYLKTDKGIDVYQNGNFIGMGFTYDTYITRSEFEKLAEGRETCSDIALNTLIVEDKDEAFVSDLLVPYEEGYVPGERRSVENFQTTSGGFSATFNADKAGIVYMAVPFEDAGWTAEINGEKTEFIRANIGLVAFRVEPGVNEIRFTYNHPAQTMGMVVSCFGFLMLVLYVILYHKFVRSKENYVMPENLISEQE
ncbi:MAG: YfhO family protein [Clostridia bacterium]|nr:YfhO family protein [Clostridia bacterium]